MIDDLVATLVSLHDRLEKHRERFSQNETATRLSLIDPLLLRLGWDTADPCMVSVEHAVQWEKRIDYVLLGLDGTPVVGIEAKSHSEFLPNHVNQMIEYSALLGAPYFVLTNARTWQLYHGFSQEESTVAKTKGSNMAQIIDDHRVFSESLTRTSPHKLARRLASLWRPDFSLIPAIPASQIICWPETTFPVPEGWSRLPNLEVNSRSTKPRRIRFPNGEERPVKFWNEIIGHTIDWLVSSEILNKEQLPVPSTRNDKQYIISSDARHANGSPFKNKRRFNGLGQLEQPVAAGQIKADTIALLEHCNLHSGDVLVVQHGFH